MDKVYSTEIKELGPEATEFLDAGMAILFQTGAPPELAEMSVLHEPRVCREAPPLPGDVLRVDAAKVHITAIGEKAWQNMRSLGHAVLKFNGEKTPELPGDICLEKLDGKRIAEAFRPGVRLEIDAETR
ncbi:PTS glucitol/sorbitol transporter subunit IIA [Rubrobacter naiadicus]|uniref:PTS glucitol/sorbitol transporter subunit IIA n=1 Tax=Rubrobacter naiadicus TaxID=1392641 RepID=UPI00236002CE|nr:PTS glucitol/sorbitol transporter subunit IIA [Rubrobacter naiadicus]